MPPTEEDMKLAPPILWDMRSVWDEPNEPVPARARDLDLRELRKLRNMKPWEFLDRLTTLEKLFLQAKNKDREFAASRERQSEEPSRTTSPSEWDGEGECPVCKRAPKVNVEDLTEWKLQELLEGMTE